MLRYKTKTRPGLVALYDIRPGNGAGQFLQPQSPHGDLAGKTYYTNAQVDLQQNQQHSLKSLDQYNRIQETYYF